MKEHSGLGYAQVMTIRSGAVADPEDGLYEITWASPTGQGVTVVGNAADASAWVATFRAMGAVAVAVARFGVRIEFPDPPLAKS